mmetsp:Transcript_23352/g.39044  ORF Transcript_23352/g.39044 Transcript_23352/m.39044 type:complete len:290 (-) Transcript_23352:412-1281(-)
MRLGSASHDTLLAHALLHLLIGNVAVFSHALADHEGAQHHPASDDVEDSAQKPHEETLAEVVAGAVLLVVIGVNDLSSLLDVDVPTRNRVVLVLARVKLGAQDDVVRKVGTAGAARRVLGQLEGRRAIPGVHNCLQLFLVLLLGVFKAESASLAVIGHTIATHGVVGVGGPHDDVLQLHDLLVLVNGDFGTGLDVGEHVGVGLHVIVNHEEREQQRHDVHEIRLELLEDSAGDEHEHAHDGENAGGDGNVKVGGLAVVAQTLEGVGGGGAGVGVSDDGGVGSFHALLHL